MHVVRLYRVRLFKRPLEHSTSPHVRKMGQQRRRPLHSLAFVVRSHVLM